MDKYINTDGFDMTSFDAERAATREAEEKAKKTYSPMSDDLMATYDAAEARKREAQRSETRRAEKLEEIASKEARYTVDDWNREQERIKAREDRLKKQAEAKADAVDLARERYAAQSRLYKLFHRRLTNDRAAKMTTSQINHLYGGVEEEKGKSR